jgi:hypothetical protein
MIKLAVIRKGFVTVRKEVRDKITRCRREQLCFGCEQKLGDGVKYRHAHEACYRALMRSVDRGETTDEELIAEGLLAEHSEPGRRVKNPAAKALRALQGN